MLSQRWPLAKTWLNDRLGSEWQAPAGWWRPCFDSEGDLYRLGVDERGPLVRGMRQTQRVEKYYVESRPPRCLGQLVVAPEVCCRSAA